MTRNKLMPNEPLTPEDQEILEKAIAELLADPMRCPTPIFMRDERLNQAEKTGRNPNKLTDMWNKMIAESENNDKQ